MDNFTKLTQSLKPTAFFGPQDLALTIGHYNIEVDALSCYVFGYEGKMSLSIYADQQGLVLVKSLVNALQKVEKFPLALTLQEGNLQAKLYMQNVEDYQMLAYCGQNLLAKLQQKAQQNQLPDKIKSQTEYIENPFG